MAEAHGPPSPPAAPVELPEALVFSLLEGALRLWFEQDEDRRRLLRDRIVHFPDHEED